MPIDLEKIGKTLKERRESKGFSLGHVSDSLCIRKSLIGAIESGNWELLPHEVYVKGYLKEYAHLLDIYDEITNEMADKEDIKPIEVPVQKKNTLRQSGLPKRAILYPLALILVIGFVVLSQLERDPQPAAQIQYAERASKSIIEPAGSERQNAIEVADGKKLMITCQERTWVSVVIDDREKKEFMLNPQDIVILNAKEKYDLLIGNAGGVKLILDGKDVQLAGVSGEVKRIKLS